MLRLYTYDDTPICLQYSHHFIAAKINNSVGFEKHNPKLQYNMSYKGKCKRNTIQVMHVCSEMSRFTLYSYAFQFYFFYTRDMFDPVSFAIDYQTKIF